MIKTQLYPNDWKTLRCKAEILNTLVKLTEVVVHSYLKK